MQKFENSPYNLFLSFNLSCNYQLLFFEDISIKNIDPIKSYLGVQYC